MTGEQTGRVLGSQHSSTSAFRVVLDDDDFLQLDDLVVVRTQVPKAGEVRTYGVVTEAEAVYEGASYESDTHRIAELGIMPATKVRTAQVQVTRVDPEVWVSPDPGEAVERAVGEERAKALYVDEMGRPLAVGIGRDGLPVHVDLDFFDGRKGGPYREDDPTGPLSVYGASKLSGERMALAACPRTTILRTSWVVSAHGKNFVKTMLRLAREGQPLRVVDDQFGRPTAAEGRAAKCERFFENVDRPLIVPERRQRASDGGEETRLTLRLPGELRPGDRECLFDVL